MKVGDLVRFKDISSVGDNGQRLFHEMDGRLGLVLRLRTDRQSGTVMVYTDLEKRFLDPKLTARGFNALYFEVVNANR